MGATWIIVADKVIPGPLVRKAQEAGGAVKAAVVGPREWADAVAAYGISSVAWYEAGGEVPVEAFAPAVAEAITAETPALVLTTEGPGSRAIAGAAAARLNAGVASGLISARLDDGGVTLEHLIIEGHAVEELRSLAPVVAIIADGGEDAELAPTPTPVHPQRATALPFRIVGSAEAAGGAANLAVAQRVVGAGRGFIEKEQLQIVEELADALDAEICCSLPLCDDYRWFPHERVVGTSTQRISPRLYLACGISGQPQHMAGVRSAKTIVAINRDAEAPIFQECDLGVVGDMREVLPALTRALRKR